MCRLYVVKSIFVFLCLFVVLGFSVTGFGEPVHPPVEAESTFDSVDTGWETEFSLQAGVWGNQWGSDGGVKEYGYDGGWDYFRDGGNFPAGLNVDNTGFQLHQIWLGLGRAVDVGCGWKADFHADFMYGTNAQFFQSARRFDSMMASEGQYGMAIPQLCVGLGNEVFHLKVGKFITPFGNDNDGFFYSDSYCPMPDTHMGTLAEWDFGNGITLMTGWTEGWNEAFGSENDSSLGWFGVSRNFCDKFKLSYIMCAGSMEGVDSTYSHSLISEFYLTEKTTFSIEYLVVNMDEDPEAGTIWGLINCLVHEVNDNIKTGLRVEYQEQEVNDETTELFEITMGITWNPFAQYEACKPCCCMPRLLGGELLIRPEIRYDSWSGAGRYAFNAGTKDHQFSGGVSLDYSF